MGDKTLKEQFEMLQEQKRKRLLKRKEIKLETSRGINVDSNNGKSGEPGILDEVVEDLNLQLCSPGVISDVNIKETDDYKDLLETVRELRDENGRLDKLLAEKEEEIKIVRRRWKAEREELVGGGIGSGDAASKIIEFSKKIRELNTAVEKEKTKSQTLERKVERFEKNSAPPKVKPPPTKDETDLIEQELSSTKEKLSNALLKYAEAKSDIETLKKEMKIAQKVLAREVGENVTFQSLISGSTGWRGRQQQILALQLKVTELQQHLDQNNQSAGNPMSSKNAFLSGISQHDEKHRLVMRKMELERKEHQDKMQKELVSVTGERDSYKEKNSAARARNKIITQDLKNIKDQLSTMVDKGKHDDELVSALLREQQYLKEENERLKTEFANRESEVERVFKPSGKYLIEKTENDGIVSKLKDEIKVQEERVKELEGEIYHLRNAKSSRQSQSCIPRPSSSRSDHVSQKTGCKEKESPNLLLQECKSLYEVAKVEKEKLSGLVQVLQRRNTEVVNEMLEKDFMINEYRNSNATLQKQIEKLSISHGRNASVTKGSGSKKKNVETYQSDINEIETKLSIQMDNNDALKSALEEALMSKDEDSKYYHQMIEQTKSIFLLGLRQYRQAQEDKS